MVRFTAALVAAGGLLCACAANRPIESAQVAAAAPTAAVDFDALLLRKDVLQRVPESLPIHIDNPYGDVRLRFGGYEHTMELHVTEQRPDHALPAFLYTHEARGDHFLIAPQLPVGASLQPNQRTDVVVYVPLGHNVRVTTARGLIEGRGVKADVFARSESGDIKLRGTGGVIDASTTSGSIEVALEDALAKSSQQLSTSTGAITVALADSADLEVLASTSAPLTTEFSVQIEHLPGQEPNKRGRAEIGKPNAQLQLESKRGEIRLLRRAAYTPVASR